MEITKKSSNAIVEIFIFSYMMGYAFGLFLWLFSLFANNAFSYWPVSTAFLVITGILLCFEEIARYKNYRLFNWIPISILISAFTAGIVLEMISLEITTLDYQTAYRLFPVLALSILWFQGKAMLNGLVEMEKITGKQYMRNIDWWKNKPYQISIVSWSFYLFMAFLNLL